MTTAGSSTWPTCKPAVSARCITAPSNMADQDATMSGSGPGDNHPLFAFIELCRGFLLIAPDDAAGRIAFRARSCPACGISGSCGPTPASCPHAGCGLHERERFIREQIWVGDSWQALLPPAKPTPEAFAAFNGHLGADPCVTVGFGRDDEGLPTLLHIPAQHLRGSLHAALIGMVQFAVGDFLRVNLDTKLPTNDIRDRISRYRQVREAWRQSDLARRKADGATIKGLAEELGVSRPTIRRQLMDREIRRRRPGRQPKPAE